MDDLKITSHFPGAPLFRLLGLGQNCRPVQGLKRLTKLLNNNAPWAKNRSINKISKMLLNSDVIITAWKGKELIGFGRATTDKSFRAVLWDVVVDKQYENLGIGKKILEAILNNPSISKVERIYLMTTSCSEFYLKQGFIIEPNQKLMTFNMP